MEKLTQWLRENVVATPSVLHVGSLACEVHHQKLSQLRHLLRDDRVQQIVKAEKVLRHFRNCRESLGVRSRILSRETIALHILEILNQGQGLVLALEAEAKFNRFTGDYFEVQILFFDVVKVLGVRHDEFDIVEV